MEPEVDIQKIKKGDFFWKGTSPTVYEALSDETQRGYVKCRAPWISVARDMRFNTTIDDLTILKEADRVRLGI